MHYTKPPGIYGFNGPYRFLSNFYIEPDGTHVEGEFQRAKCAEEQDRQRFSPNTCTTPFHDPAFCKGLGRKVKLREDWEAVKVEVMVFYVTKKFRDHPRLAERLRETGTLYLEETNAWGDSFWGVSRGYGLNMLGAILMDVRGGL